MKTVRFGTLISASLLVLASFSSGTANAQWRDDRRYDDRTMREKIEDKIAREREAREARERRENRDRRYDRRYDRRDDRRDDRYERRDDRWEERYGHRDCCDHNDRFDPKHRGRKLGHWKKGRG